jgi:hypothetical protein
MLRQNHQRVMERIRATPDAELQRPFTDYQPGADPRGTVMLSLVYNTFHHYQEHLPWITAIVEEK